MFLSTVYQRLSAIGGLWYFPQTLWKLSLLCQRIFWFGFGRLTDDQQVTAGTLFGTIPRSWQASFVARGLNGSQRPARRTSHKSILLRDGSSGSWMINIQKLMPTQLIVAQTLKTSIPDPKSRNRRLSTPDSHRER